MGSLIQQSLQGKKINSAKYNSKIPAQLDFFTVSSEKTICSTVKCSRMRINWMSPFFVMKTANIIRCANILLRFFMNCLDFICFCLQINRRTNRFIWIIMLIINESSRQFKRKNDKNSFIYLIVSRKC